MPRPFVFLLFSFNWNKDLCKSCKSVDSSPLFQHFGPRDESESLHALCFCFLSLFFFSPFHPQQVFWLGIFLNPSPREETKYLCVCELDAERGREECIIIYEWSLRKMFAAFTQLQIQIREREREDRFSLRRLRWSDLLSAEQIFGLFVFVLFYFTWSISSVLTCLVSIFMSESLLTQRCEGRHWMFIPTKNNWKVLHAHSSELTDGGNSLLRHAGKIQGGDVELLKVVVLLFDDAHYFLIIF